MTRIGFIGAGQMAAAMAGGLRKTDLFSHYTFSDVTDAALENILRFCPKASVTRNNSEVLEKSDVVVLAIKPQVAVDMLSPLAPKFEERHLVVSIMAGVTNAQLRKLCGPGPRLARVMPNTGLLVGAGASCVACDSTATSADAALVQKMFSSLGFCAQVKESMLDAVTGVSGSGPAYVALFIEAMADGGVAAGLPRPLAQQLAAHTVLGASSVVAKGAVASPAALKDMVCSPAGTTIAAVCALEERGLRSAVIQGVLASTNRAKELSKL